ncbi:MAG: hypothetical protein JST00_19235 [Deltaproteobacteria bacterium]|nr:hypothetical protein [Deltaproteobacteria bacterium]
MASTTGRDSVGSFLVAAGALAMGAGILAAILGFLFGIDEPEEAKRFFVAALVLGLGGVTAVVTGVALLYASVRRGRRRRRRP